MKNYGSLPSAALITMLVLQAGCAYTVNTRQLGSKPYEEYEGPVQMESVTSSRTHRHRHHSSTYARTTHQCYRDNVTRYELTMQRYYKNTGVYYLLGGLGSATMGVAFYALNDREDDFHYEPFLDVIGISLMVGGGIAAAVGLVNLATPEPEEEPTPSIYYEYEDIPHREYVACD